MCPQIKPAAICLLLASVASWWSGDVNSWPIETTSAMELRLDRVFFAAPEPEAPPLVLQADATWQSQWLAIEP